MPEEKLISKKSLKKAYHNWIFYSLSIFNLERMQGPAMVKVFEGLADDLYPNNPEEQKSLLARHSIFFNTQPTLGAIVPGIVIGMEEERAKGGEISDDLINGIKTALMGPFAGIGDSMIQGTLIPILISIAMGLSQNGSVLGIIFLLASFLGINIPLTWFMFSTGYKMGAEGAQKVLSGGLKEKITKAIDVVGLIVIGAITATYTTVTCGLVFTSGKLKVDINNMFEGITPKFLVIIFAMLFYWLMKKKKWSANRMIVFSLVVSIVGYLTHILK